MALYTITLGKSQSVNSLSVRGLIYYKQSFEGWCYRTVSCDHRRTCVPAAGVTQHLDPSSSSLLSSVSVLHTETHKHEHTRTDCSVPVVPFGIDPDGVIH